MPEFKRTPMSPLVRNLSRRESMRVATSLPATLLMTNYPAPELPARVIDLGIAGACVQTDTPIDGSAARAIRISLGENDAELAVEAKWQSDPLPEQGPLTGFAFKRVDATQESELWNFIQMRSRELATFIRSCVGLAVLGFEDAFNLALSTRLRHVAVGRPVYRPTDPSASSIFAVVEGSVVLEEVGTGGVRHRLGTAKPGDAFGGMSVLAGCQAIESAIATQESKLIEFPSYTVEHLVATKPNLGIVLMRATCYQWIVRLRDSYRAAGSRP